jgi:hypothetical protein
MRTPAQLPDFLVTRAESTSPSYVLRAALAERLAWHPPMIFETGVMAGQGPVPALPPSPEAPALTMAAQ